MKNKYRFFLILVIGLIVIISSGCIKMDTAINIDKKGNATINETFLVANSYWEWEEETDYNDSTDLDATAKKLNQDNKNIKNYNTKVIHDGEYTGLQSFYEVENISEHDIKINDTNLNFYKPIKDNAKLIEVTKSTFYTDYNIDMIYKADKGLEVVNTRIKFSITIPVKAYEHNATTVDEKTHTYTWISPEEIKLKFKVLNIAVILSIVLIIFILISLLTSLFIFLKKYKIELKENKKECPFCGEKIDINESQCKYCGENLNNEIKNE